MAGAAADAIFGKLVDLFVQQVWAFTGRQVGYVLKHKSYAHDLCVGADKLNNEIHGLQQSVNIARNNLENIDKNVEAWLECASDIVKEAIEVLKSDDIVEKRCFYGWCPNLKSRYSLGKKSIKWSTMIGEHLKTKSEFSNISYKRALNLAASWSSEGFRGFESRRLVMEKVMEALRDEEINTIGICGMGGVGKTTLIKEVARRAEIEGVVKKVAIAVVSQNPNIRKIQQEIADCLSLPLKSEFNIDVRSASLSERLKVESKLLVILDDVWTEIDWIKFGIPFSCNDKGCKIVVTSRRGSACSGAKLIVDVQSLTEEEAWAFFQENANISPNSTNLANIAREIAKECQGLPIAILTISQLLKDKEIYTWNDVLSRLRRSSIREIPEVHEKVYLCIESSYNYLKSDEARKLLLLCCLFQEDYNIKFEILFRYVVGLHLLEDVGTLAEARDRVFTLIDQLESCNLVITCDKWTLKLHDVIRDVCINIAKKEHGFMVECNAMMQEWPQERAYDNCTAISVMSERMHELPAVLDCPKLELLQLIFGNSDFQMSDLIDVIYRNNPWIVTYNRPQVICIPENIFEKMKQIKVAFFQCVLFSPLPPSLEILMNLRALCFEGCSLSVNMSMIGSLQRLEVLSFLGSSLPEGLPIEIGRLTQLRLLDLRCEILAYIPAGVLSSLKKLEELYMGEYFRKDAAEELNGGDCAKIAELSLLSCLSTLQVSILPLKVESLMGLRFGNLTRFQIHIFSGCKMFSEPLYDFRRNVLVLDQLDLN